MKNFVPGRLCLFGEPTPSDDRTARLWRVEGLDKLLLRGFDWLKDYFITHPEAIEKLEVCQKQFSSEHPVN